MPPRVETPANREMIARLSEMTMTIDLVDDTDENGDGSHQGSIDDEPSAGEETQRPSRSTSEQNLQNRDGSKGIHLLVSNDQGVIGDGDDFEQKGQHRELEDPMRCHEASLGDIQLIRRCKAIAEDGEHRHHRTHNAKDAQVIDSQIRKSESRGPKVEPHREQHASIEQAGVAHDALLAIGGVRIMNHK